MRYYISLSSSIKTRNIVEFYYTIIIALLLVELIKDLLEEN
jgi:hypothetical protein